VPPPCRVPRVRQAHSPFHAADELKADTAADRPRYWLPGPATAPTGGTVLFRRDLTTLPLERRTRPSRSTFGTSGTAATGTQVSYSSSKRSRAGSGRAGFMMCTGGRVSNQAWVISISRLGDRLATLHEVVLRGRRHEDCPVHENRHPAAPLPPAARLIGEPEHR
jgi:hypothetical protein